MAADELAADAASPAGGDLQLHRKETWADYDSKRPRGDISAKPAFDAGFDAGVVAAIMNGKYRSASPASGGEWRLDCGHCLGKGTVPGDPEADPIEECQYCNGRGHITVGRALLRKVVDLTYGYANEDKSVPATKTADKLIDRAVTSLALSRILGDALAPASPAPAVTEEDVIVPRAVLEAACKHIDPVAQYKLIEAIDAAMIRGAVPAVTEEWQLIEKLRAPEGHSVTLICDNPDFNGQPNCAVECVGDWTDWKQRRFTGDTVLEALRAAEAAMIRGHGTGESNG